MLKPTYTQTAKRELGALKLEEFLGLQVAADEKIGTETPLDPSGVFNTQLHSATGADLPPVETELERKINLEKLDLPLGELATESMISTTTACWSIIKGRDKKGYVRKYNAHKYGLNSFADKRHGILLHRMAYLLNREVEGRTLDLTVNDEIDHVCRNTACCNPLHLEKVDKHENNLRRDKARRLETALTAGQIMLGPVGISWLDSLMQQSVVEDTKVIITTKTGPYRLIKTNDDPLLFYGSREPCEVYDALMPPARDKSKRKSRAKLPAILEGQQNIYS